jgi:hypothetical protein
MEEEDRRVRVRDMRQTLQPFLSLQMEEAMNQGK